MNNFRVIVSGNSSDGFSYRIEDVYAGFLDNVYPFVNHEPSIVASNSVDNLKAILKQMLEACDKPPLRLTRQELVEDLEA